MSLDSFTDDYSEGAHPHILQALGCSNLEQQAPYGNDEYCAEASRLLRQQVRDDKVSILFATGGTAAKCSLYCELPEAS